MFSGKPPFKLFLFLAVLITLPAFILAANTRTNLLEHAASICNTSNCQSFCSGISYEQQQCINGICTLYNTIYNSPSCGGPTPAPTCNTSNCQSFCSGTTYEQRACVNNNCTIINSIYNDSLCSSSSTPIPSPTLGPTPPPCSNVGGTCMYSCPTGIAAIKGGCPSSIMLCCRNTPTPSAGAQCRAVGGSCIGSRICISANDLKSIGMYDCTSGTICCKSL